MSFMDEAMDHVGEQFRAAIAAARLEDTPERMALYRELFTLGWQAGALDAMREMADLLTSRCEHISATIPD